MTKTTLRERYNKKFRHLDHKSWEELLSFIEQEKQLSVRETVEKIEEISTFLGEDSLSRVLMHYKSESSLITQTK